MTIGLSWERERAFGVFQKCFAFIPNIDEYWKLKVLWQTKTCCMILHYMIIDDEQDMEEENFQYVHLHRRSCWVRTRCKRDIEISLSISTHREVRNASSPRWSHQLIHINLRLCFFFFTLFIPFVLFIYLNGDIWLASNNLVCRHKFYSFLIMLFDLIDRFACV
jgi:hypothetical protein